MKISDSKLSGECPECGAARTEFTRKTQHVNGEWFDSITYACGNRLDWVPNFSAVRPSSFGKCSRSAAAIANKAKVSEVSTKLIEMLECLPTYEMMVDVINATSETIRTNYLNRLTDRSNDRCGGY